ncbi:TPA: hypothetical protein I9287_002145 [Legionella pneumophila]|nr:hypothetical protein [Legionella pneumophila]
MIREDLSTQLFHWVTGEDYYEAMEALLSIIDDNQIYGSNNNIKGSFSCICFTEAPAKYFDFSKTRYKPFGISIPKTEIFKLGGRPVIYQTDKEYELLGDEIKWRHVRFDPCGNPSIDFTWEREWRIKAECIDLPDTKTTIAVPNNTWVYGICEEFDSREWLRYQYEVMGYGEDLARPPNSIQYEIITIDDI